MSSNGTFVNGKLVGKGNKVLLRHNDHVELSKLDGYFIFRNPVAESVLQATDREWAISDSFFVLDKVIGRGAFGQVRIAVHRETGRRVACKLIFKDRIKISQRQMNHIRQEIAILMTVQHPNLVKVWEICETDRCIAFFMDLFEGGDLLSTIESRGRLNEQEARFAFYQLLRGIQYLHQQNMCHRDIKLENILVETKNNPYSRLVIADFGLAKSGLNQTMLKTFCGTLGYIAPEVLVPNKGYTIAVDCWSLGVILYCMLSGSFPFPDESDSQLTDAVRAGNYDFDSPEWNDISTNAKDLISKLIVVDPEVRLSVEDALLHPFIAEFSEELAIIYKLYILDRIPTNETPVVKGN